MNFPKSKNMLSSIRIQGEIKSSAPKQEEIKIICEVVEKSLFFPKI